MSHPSGSKALFKKLIPLVLAKLESQEAARLQLSGETSDFIRFNHGRIRHSHSTDQVQIKLIWQKSRRELQFTFTLNQDLKQILQLIEDFLTQSRLLVSALPEQQGFVAITGNLQEERQTPSQIPPLEYFLTEFPKTIAQDDLAGLVTRGFQYEGLANHLGEFLWFEAETFFIDYSLYEGRSASKGGISGAVFSESTWLQNLQQTRQNLEFLKKPRKKITPGAYRVYLAPAALYELIEKLKGWGLEYPSPLSLKKFKQGSSPFSDLIKGHRSLSEKFTLYENSSLGFVPSFNSLGEKVPENLPLIHKGQLKNMLVSTNSAHAYEVNSLNIDVAENILSPDVAPGSLCFNDILPKLEQGLYLSNLHYVNFSDLKTARVTGMTRYACYWVENGQIQSPIEDMRFDVSLYDVWGDNLLELTDFTIPFLSTDTYSHRNWGGARVPGALVQNFQFTL